MKIAFLASLLIFKCRLSMCTCAQNVSKFKFSVLKFKFLLLKCLKIQNCSPRKSQNSNLGYRKLEFGIQGPEFGNLIAYFITCTKETTLRFKIKFLFRFYIPPGSSLILKDQIYCASFKLNNIWPVLLYVHTYYIFFVCKEIILITIRQFDFIKKDFGDTKLYEKICTYLQFI